MVYRLAEQHIKLCGHLREIINQALNPFPTITLLPSLALVLRLQILCQYLSLHSIFQWPRDYELLVACFSVRFS